MIRSAGAGATGSQGPGRRSRRSNAEGRRYAASLSRM